MQYFFVRINRNSKLTIPINKYAAAMIPTMINVTRISLSKNFGTKIIIPINKSNKTAIITAMIKQNLTSVFTNLFIFLFPFHTMSNTHFAIVHLKVYCQICNPSSIQPQHLLKKGVSSVRTNAAIYSLFGFSITKNMCNKANWQRCKQIYN